MRLIITGVSGFVGHHTAVTAVMAGHSVVAVGRQPLSEELSVLGVEEYKWVGWPTQIGPSGLREIIEKFGSIDAIIHIAGDAHYGNGKSYLEANVAPTDLLLKCIKEVNPKIRFVLASSVGAQDFPRVGSAKLHDENTKPVPRSDYGRSKLNAEQIVKSSGLDYSIARLGMVIGREMRLDSHVAVLLKIASSPVIRRFVSLFRGVLPVVHVDDVADALLLLADNRTPSDLYLVVSKNLSIKTIVNAPHAVKGGAGVIGLGVFAGIFPAKLGTAMSPVMNFDSARIRAIGWVPKVDVLEAVREVYVKMQEKPFEVHIVTGVASGLGKAFMQEIIRNKGLIIGIDRDSLAIDELRNLYPSHFYICADVTDSGLYDQILGILNEIVYSTASLYLVAGLGTKSKFIDQEIENIRLQFEVNVLARLNLAQRFLQNLRNTERTGRLFVVSSSTALQPLSDFVVYGATNAALLSFGRALIAETDRNLCQILVLIPGGMDTNFQQSAGVRRLENERLLDPSLVARRILKSQSSKSKIQIIGKNARVFQIMSRALPWGISDAIWARLTKLTR